MVKKMVREILKHLGLEKSEVSVVLCDNAFIQDLNSKWRNKDMPTDVLSFPAIESEQVKAAIEQPEMEKIPLILGDVVISLDIVHERTGETGETPELLRLLVHGLVHLLGHDHVKDADAKKMEKLEKVLLQHLGTVFS